MILRLVELNLNNLKLVSYVVYSKKDYKGRIHRGEDINYIKKKKKRKTKSMIKGKE